MDLIYSLPKEEFKAIDNFMEMIEDSLVFQDFWDIDHTSRYVTVEEGHVVGIDYYDGNLTQLPESFGDLIELKWLNFSGNKIKKFPDSFSKLKNLETLLIGYNNIEFIPECIRMFKKLRYLELSSYNRKMIPDWIGELTSLEKLSLGDCHYKFFPNWIKSLKNLKFLGFENNPLRKIPHFIVEMKSLVDIEIFQEPGSNFFQRMKRKSIIIPRGVFFKFRFDTSCWQLKIKPFRMKKEENWSIFRGAEEMRVIVNNSEP